MPFSFSRSSTKSSSSSTSSSKPPTLTTTTGHDAHHTSSGHHSKELKPILTQSSTIGSGHSHDRSITLISSPASPTASSASDLHQAVARGAHAAREEEEATLAAHDHDPEKRSRYRSRSHERHGRKPSSSRHGSERYELPKFRDPIHLAETAITTLFSIPGPPLEQLKHEILPKLYHEAYEHRVNCREHGLDEIIALVQRFRSKYSWVKIRFRSHLMDMDGTATMHAAAVGLVYDIHTRPMDSHHNQVHTHRSSTTGGGGGGRSDAEPTRTPVISVVKIFEGRIAQVDMVVDTKEMQGEASQPEMSCSVM